MPADGEQPHHAAAARMRLAAGQTTAKRWLAIGLAAAAVAGGAWAIDRIVQAEALRLVQSEVAAVAEQAVSDAEAPIAAAAKVLADLARGGPVDCLRQTVLRLRDRAASAPDVVIFDVVDASGLLMCSSSGEPTEPAQLLPELTPRMPPVTIAPDPRPDRRGLLVAWTAATGTRLVAELSPELPRMPAGPAFAAGRMSITLSVADLGVWRRTGPAHDRTTEFIAASAAGKSFPLVAEVAVDAQPTPPEFRRIEGAIRFAAVLLIGALLAFGWMGRRRRKARAKARPQEAARAVIGYRPVVEIGTGAIVGIDVAVAGLADAAALADVRFLDRILTEVAPVLRAHPTLKLSLPAVFDPTLLARLAQALTQTAPRFSVPPGKVVIAAAAAGPEASRAFEAIRSAGMLLSLDRVAVGEGGGLMALARHRPDFITIDSDLDGDADADPKGLTILRALVGIARDLDIGVIMRGIAGPEQVERLRAIGITTASGPAFGPPLRAHMIAALVAAAAADAGQARVA